MKKYISVLSVLILAVFLTACAEKTAEETTAPAEAEEDSMVMVPDDAEFSEKLGMTVDTSLVPVMGMGRYIVEGEIAYFCFGIEEEGREPAIVLLRATKNSGLKDSLSGVEGEKTPLDDEEICGLRVTRTDIKADDQVYHQYGFEKDGIFYCLSIIGDIPDEQFETLFASFLEAIRPA